MIAAARAIGAFRDSVRFTRAPPGTCGQAEVPPLLEVGNLRCSLERRAHLTTSLVSTGGHHVGRLLWRERSRITNDGSDGLAVRNRNCRQEAERIVPRLVEKQTNGV